MKKLIFIIISTLVFTSCAVMFETPQDTEPETKYENEIEYIIEGEGTISTLLITNDWGNSDDYEDIVLTKGNPWLYSIKKINRGDSFSAYAYINENGGIVKISIYYHGKLISTDTNSGKGVSVSAGIKIKK